MKKNDDTVVVSLAVKNNKSCNFLPSHVYVTEGDSDTIFIVLTLN